MSLTDDARAIYAEALRAVDVHAAVRRNIRLTANTLLIGPATVPLSALDRILIVALGKAAVPMYEAAAEVLADALPHEALIVAPPETLPTSSSPHARFLPGAHPTPDARSLAAAHAALDLLASTTPRTAMLFLISGGASAMFEQPLSTAITLDEVAAFNRALVASGLSIAQMNALRKHTSAVKGGRLAVAASAAAAQVTLLVSDVPSASPDAIGSGPSLPDTTTLADCREILGRLPPSASLPASFEALLQSASTPETPKPGDPTFARSHSQVILSSDDLATAALFAARSLGFHAEIDNTCDEHEYREAARYLLDRSAALAHTHRRSCLISVGELAVALPPNPGVGGRNQQFALHCALELAHSNRQATVLSAGSDGIDGISSAAGAVCDATTPARAVTLGFSTERALATFNTAPLLAAIGDAIVTGPTGNNLRDLRLILRD